MASALPSLLAAALLCAFLTTLCSFTWTGHSQARHGRSVEIVANVRVDPVIDSEVLAENNPILVRAKDGMCTRHCHQCYMGMSPKNNCQVCKHKFYLLDGACLQHCPKTHKAVGHGVFDRRCVLLENKPAAPALKKKSKSASSSKPLSALSPVSAFARARRENGAKTQELIAAAKDNEQCDVADCRRCGAMGLCIVCKPTFFLRNGRCMSSPCGNDGEPCSLEVSTTPKQSRGSLLSSTIVSLSSAGLYLWRNVLEQPVQRTSHTDEYTGEALFGSSIVKYMGGVTDPLTLHNIQTSAIVLVVELLEEKEKSSQLTQQWLEVIKDLSTKKMLGLFILTDACRDALSPILPYLHAFKFVLMAKSATAPKKLTFLPNVFSFLPGMRLHESDPARILFVEDWPRLARPFFCHVDGPVLQQSPIAKAMALVGDDKRECLETDSSDPAAAVEVLRQSDYAVIHADTALVFEQQVCEAVEAGAIPIVVRAPFACTDIYDTFADAPFLWVDSIEALPAAIAQAPSSTTALAAVTAQRIALRRWLEGVKRAHRDFLLGLLQK
eukprot:m.68793 g.68793  ORF g.68793 m.68793 type:complete len:554 (+) comp12793_c1_seq1:43-1704(+)